MAAEVRRPSWKSIFLERKLMSESGISEGGRSLSAGSPCSQETMRFSLLLVQPHR